VGVMEKGMDIEGFSKATDRAASIPAGRLPAM
jgi:hypothetical protein